MVGPCEGEIRGVPEVQVLYMCELHSQHTQCQSSVSRYGDVDECITHADNERQRPYVHLKYDERNNIWK